MMLDVTRLTQEENEEIFRIMNLAIDYHVLYDLIPEYIGVSFGPCSTRLSIYLKYDDLEPLLVWHSIDMREDYSNFGLSSITGYGFQDGCECFSDKVIQFFETIKHTVELKEKEKLDKIYKEREEIRQKQQKNLEIYKIAYGNKR